MSNSSFQGFSHHSLHFCSSVNCTSSSEFHDKVSSKQIDSCLLIGGPSGTTSDRQPTTLWSQCFKCSIFGISVFIISILSQQLTW